MKNKVINLAQKIKEFLATDFKMKLLVAYLILNLLYLTIGSYMFMTKQIVENFNYQLFSLGLKNIMVLNTFVFLVICFERKYKKNLAHIFIVAVAATRWYCYVVCF